VEANIERFRVGAAIHNTAALKGEACSPVQCVTRLKFGGVFLVWALFVHSVQGLAAEKDTITVDGTPILLELAITETDPAVVSHSVKGKVKRGSRRGPDVCAGLGTGWILHPDNATGDRLSRFIGKGDRLSISVPWAAEWEQGARLVRLELGLETHCDWAYDATFLDDSLYQIAPDENGGLEQWVAIDVGDLGIELDTLPLPTLLYASKSATLALCTGGVLNQGRTNKGLIHRWWMGFHGRWTWDNRTEREVNRLPDAMLPSPAQTTGSDRNDWEENRHFTWGLQAGASRRIRKTPVEWMMSGQFVAGPRPRWSVMLGVQYRWVSSGR